MARHLIALLAASAVAFGIVQLVRVEGVVAESIVGILAGLPGTLAVFLWARVFTEPNGLLEQNIGRLAVVVVLLGLNVQVVRWLEDSGAPWATVIHGGLAVLAGLGIVFVFWLRAELRARASTAQLSKG